MKLILLSNFCIKFMCVHDNVSRGLKEGKGTRVHWVFVCMWFGGVDSVAVCAPAASMNTIRNN